MKKYITGKRSIVAILILCILFSFGASCVCAASATPEENSVETEEILKELVPVMTRSCPCTHIWSGNWVSSSSSCKTCSAIGMRNEICKKCSATRMVCQSCGAVR